MNPKNVIDVGCAIGDFVKWFENHQVESVGIEGSHGARKYAMTDKILYFDIRIPLINEEFRFNFDLAMSIEVAEHIEPQYADVYVKNLTMMSENLLLTIAGPGQKGHSHVNLQPMTYWDGLFAKFNYYRHAVIESKLKGALHPHRGNRWVGTIINNLCFYQEGANGK
jgi:cyclopropane fatty-acyl-phospholipid synthase-like methyltransferase